MPQCPQCSATTTPSNAHEMQKVSELFGTIKLYDENGDLAGMRNPVLYQCLKCKTVSVI